MSKAEEKRQRDAAREETLRRAADDLRERAFMCRFYAEKYEEEAPLVMLLTEMAQMLERFAAINESRPMDKVG